MGYVNGTSVTFSKMAPGTYKFYKFSAPPYGELNTTLTPLNGGNAVTINVGVNTGF